MEFQGLDRLFSDFSDRLSALKPSADVYSEGPLASDHLLLQQSWEYFRRRVQAVEEHWEEIVRSKQAQFEALEEEIQTLRSELSEVREENKMLASFADSIKNVRSDEIKELKRTKDRLEMTGEEERDRLRTELDQLRLSLNEARDQLKALEESRRVEREREREKIAAYEKQLEVEREKHVASNQSAAENLSDQTDLCQSLQTKVDLLRGEVERRTQAVHGLQDDLARARQEIAQKDKMISERDLDMKAHDDRLSALRREYDVLLEEKNMVKSLWEKEQAQWRELWDRERERLEKERGA